MNNEKELTICFFGSSDEGLKEKLAVIDDSLVDSVVQNCLNLDLEKLRVVTGGYGGLMNLVAKKFCSYEGNISVEIIGVTCDAYDIVDEGLPTYKDSNDISKFNNLILQAKDFTDRIQIMLEMSDIFIVLPGRQGTLSEMIIASEAFNYKSDTFKNKNTKIFIHERWKKLLNNTEYFRPIYKINYFTKDNLFEILKDIDIKKFNKSNLDEIDVTKNNRNKVYFNLNELYGQIQSSFYGKLFKKEKLETLKGNDNFSENILSIDFGWSIDSKRYKKSEFLNIASKKYNIILKDFLSIYNSLMFNTKESNFKVKHLPNEIVKNVELEHHLENIEISNSNEKMNPEFDNWGNFLIQFNYGQTLIWQNLYFKINENSNINLSIFLLFNIKLPQTKVNDIKRLIDAFFYNESASKIAELFDKKENELLFQATRAAITQVQARNGTHNIGSHVLNNLITSLGDKDFTIQNYLESLFILKHHHNEDNLKHCFDTNKKPIPKCTELLLAQLGIFNAYVKNRMEYLGDMAMNTPMMSSSKYLINDLFREFDKVRLLLDNISGLDEQFKYTFAFKINETVISANNWNQADIKLAIPNDITGCQAFYNILENIIRNTAKHSQRNSNVLITFTIDIQDATIENGENGDEYWQINIYDDVEIEKIDEIVSKQNEILNIDVLDESTNSLRQGSLGMIEMDASAAYLRKLDIALINSSEYDLEKINDTQTYKTRSGKLPILNAAKYKKASLDSEEAKCLGYQFYIEKPKEYLFVLENIDKYKKKSTEYIKLGIDFLTKEKFEKKLKDKKTFAHQFVLTNTDFCEEITKQKAQYSPRVIKLEAANNSIVKELFCALEKLEDIEINKTVWLLMKRKLLTNCNHHFRAQADNFQNNNDLYQFVFNNHGFNPHFINNKIAYLQTNYLSNEVLSSLAQSKLPHFNSITSDIPNLEITDKLRKYMGEINSNYPQIVNELGIAAESKIFVLDERIQKFSNSIYKFQEQEISHYRLYKAMNIYMPHVNCERSEIDTDAVKTFKFDLHGELDNNLIAQAEDFIKVEKPNFVLIHFGILERVFGKEKDSKIPELLKNCISKYTNTEFIVTSGRTRVENLPNGIRFVNLAPVLSAFTEIRLKYAIYKILNDSRI